MKKLLLTAAFVAFGGVAHAHDYSTDLFCSVTDTTGRQTSWTFANNTSNAAGDLGTMVETSVGKSNGQTITSAPGTRPIWIEFPNKANGLTLQWRQDPTWMLVLANFSTNGNWNNSAVTLYHKGRLVGAGQCSRATVTTVNNAADQGVD
jgi:hypothetical protein